MNPSWAETYWTDTKRDGFVSRQYFFYREFDLTTKTGVAVFPDGFRIPLF